MRLLLVLIWLAGFVQFGIAVTNIWVPGKLDVRGNLARISPMLRSVFIVHWIYIALVLVIFGLLCVFFAPELSSGSPLARYLCGAIALFWLARVGIQLLYYDAALRRQHRLADVAFLSSITFVGGLFAVLALGWTP